MQRIVVDALPKIAEELPDRDPAPRCARAGPLQQRELGEHVETRAADRERRAARAVLPQLAHQGLRLAWHLDAVLTYLAVQRGSAHPKCTGGFRHGRSAPGRQHADDLPTFERLDAGQVTGYKTATAFFIMVILLIFRPQGLLKGRLF